MNLIYLFNASASGELSRCHLRTEQ